MRRSMIRRLLAAGLDLAATGLETLAARVAVPEWCIHITEDGTHSYPLADAIEHGPDPDCVCGPTVRRETCDHDSDLWTYRHHPLTQRDTLED